MKTKFYTQAEMLRASEQILERARPKILREAIDLMFHLALWAVWDTIPKVSKKRLKRILDFMSEKAEYIVDGSVSLEDIKKMLKEEADITIDFVEDEK